MHTNKNKIEKGLRIALIAAIVCIPATAQNSSSPWQGGKWMTGDFHQHSLFTDGSYKMADVMSHGFANGLDWQANSEHGGSRPTDGLGKFWDDTEAYPANPIIGDVATSTVAGVSHKLMWRWQSLRDFAFPMIQSIRKQYPDKLVLTGMEWNMPGHEHCSTGIVAKDAAPISQFEYLFDSGDTDVTGGLAQNWGGKIAKNDHAKAVAGAAWMYQNYPKTSWVVPAHPERAASYRIQDFRDLNNAAPTVAFGFEGMPGHQKEVDRGSYTSGAVGGGTYGGAGIYIAKVGGLWDAMLGEGRRWWSFVNSDFHVDSSDYWPGEYARTYTFVKDSNGDGQYSAEDVVDSLRSGNSYSVHGDLINGLEFTVRDYLNTATMGQELKTASGTQVSIRVRFRGPKTNSHGDAVTLDHVDLIAGEVKGLVSPFQPDGKTPNPAYSKDTNETTRVIARATSNSWTLDADGWYSVWYSVTIDKPMYFRLRGTNMPPNTAYETNAAGDPLLDADAMKNLKITTEQEAWRDLWFYSNPVFVSVY
jgi:hypothetical protein